MGHAPVHELLAALPEDLVDLLLELELVEADLRAQVRRVVELAVAERVCTRVPHHTRMHTYSQHSSPPLHIHHYHNTDTMTYPARSRAEGAPPRPRPPPTPPPPCCRRTCSRWRALRAASRPPQLDARARAASVSDRVRAPARRGWGPVRGAAQIRDCAPGGLSLGADPTEMQRPPSNGAALCKRISPGIIEFARAMGTMCAG